MWLVKIYVCNVKMSFSYFCMKGLAAVKGFRRGVIAHTIVIVKPFNEQFNE